MKKFDGLVACVDYVKIRIGEVDFTIKRNDEDGLDIIKTEAFKNTPVDLLVSPESKFAISIK